MSRRLAGLTLLAHGRTWCAVFVLGLAGCANIATPTPPASPQAAPAGALPEPAPTPVASPGPGESAALASFEHLQREKALDAARQERWAEALWAWDVVLALKPQDPAALAQRAQAQSAASAAAAQAHARARQAKQRSDADAAVRAYLDVLVISPGDTAAADGLREIERQRSQRGNVLAQRPSMAWTDPRPGPGNSGGAAARDPAEDQALEHASLLATQGDLDSAIALLSPLAAGERSGPAVRSSLGELFWRQAQLAESRGDRAKAVAALRQCLQWSPGHRAAALRLAALGGSANVPSSRPSGNPPSSLSPAQAGGSSPTRSSR